uniref:Glycosyltransferase n=1 Tax=viral metagenome TaxID=1070528 RepID=A0A6C0BX30_9ZZZZ
MLYWKSILFGVLILIVFYIIITNRCGVESFNTKPRFALLLTTYNENIRTPMYTDVINWWLNNSNFKIFVIDSYGTGFPHITNDRVSVFSFDQSKYFNEPHNIGQYELFALWKGILHWGNLFNEYDYIIKLTGKYRLPVLVSRLNAIDNNTYDIILQHAGGHEVKWQNTECIGFNAKSIKSIIKYLYFEDKTSFDRGLEYKIYLLSLYSKYSFYKIKEPMKIPIQYKVKRNFGDFLEYL